MYLTQRVKTPIYAYCFTSLCFMTSLIAILFSNISHSPPSFHHSSFFSFSFLHMSSNNFFSFPLFLIFPLPCCTLTVMVLDIVPTHSDYCNVFYSRHYIMFFGFLMCNTSRSYAAALITVFFNKCIYSLTLTFLLLLLH